MVSIVFAAAFRKRAGRGWLTAIGALPRRTAKIYPPAAVSVSFHEHSRRPGYRQLVAPGERLDRAFVVSCGVTLTRFRSRTTAIDECENPNGHISATRRFRYRSAE